MSKRTATIDPVKPVEHSVERIQPFTPDLERIMATFISKHWDWKVMDASPGLTLIGALVEKLPHIDPSSWTARLAWGGTFVNGRDADIDHPLEPPCRIEYYEPRFDYTQAHTFFPSFEKDRICYEDEYLMVYVKPSRLPCVPAREQRHNNLRTFIDSYVGAPCHMPSRLDMSTYGLVPASKHPLTHHGLQKVYQYRKVKKIYRFETDRTIDWTSVSVQNKITKHPDHAVLRRCSSIEGKDAHTEFQVLGRKKIGSKVYSLIEARPITGRTHQIRLHAHFLGCPILGDNFYAGTPNDYLHLACWSLAFPHPLTGEQLDISIPEELAPAWAQLPR